MANKSVFASTVGKLLPRPDSRNREGAPAYAYDARHQLAQLAVTGCLNGTFHAEAREQLAAVLDLCRTVEPAFIAWAVRRTERYRWQRHPGPDNLPTLVVAGRIERGRRP